MYTHSNHIPQPPHSVGANYKGLRPKIDYAQVPSPIDAIEHDRHNWETKFFMTLPGTHAPLCTSDFVAVDQGNSSPKFIRVSTWNMPNTHRLASACHIPLAAIFQPFAELDPREEPVPVVDAGSTGPARCSQCRAYINPWCSWIAGGMRWKCNLCAHETEVTTEYFSNLDANFLRLDHLERPELNKGTLDFDVTNSKEYWAQHPPERISQSYYSPTPAESGSREPQPLDYIFAFDVSTESVSSGFLLSACEALKIVLFGGTDTSGTQLPPAFPQSCRVAIVTYDTTIHFYDLSLDLNPMLVVSDLEEVFVPRKNGLLVDTVERRHSIESLLNSLPDRFVAAPHGQTALGSAVAGCLATLAGRGGHVVFFHSSLPTIGLGALPSTPPAEQSMYDTDKEPSLFKSRSSEWMTIAEECAEEGVGVSMFLAPNKFMDVASVGVVPTVTGGEMFWHPRFVDERDGPVLRTQLARLVSRTQGYNCMVKVRCSNGLKVKAHHGGFYQSSSTELEFGQLSADATFSVELEHTKALSPRENAFIQCAALYTSVDGRRRVRVINLALNVVELAGNVFQFADLESVVTHWAKQAMGIMSQQRSVITREEMTERCSSLLLGYRTQCAQATKPSQLIIPEAFRALPAFTLALQKTKPLKASIVASDVRNFYLCRILSMTPRSLMYHLYPRMVALHDLDDRIALPRMVETENGSSIEKVTMPACMRNSYFHMEANGVYLIDNEDIMVFWIGSSSSPQILNDLFGVDDITSINPRLNTLPVFSTTLSQQVHNILAHRFYLRGRPSKMLIARQNMDAAEIEFSDMLVEDQNNGAMSYMDYLAVVHKQISTVLHNGGSITNGTGIRGSPW